MNKLTCGIFLFDTTGRFLICRATGSDNWSIPKGLLNNNELPYYAAVRELYEETGINLENEHGYIVFDHTDISNKISYKNNRKILVAFHAKLFWRIVDVSTLVCTSLIDGSNKPEVDAYEMVFPFSNTYPFNRIHDTQKKYLSYIMDRI